VGETIASAGTGGHRAFGFWTCLALVVGSMIGTGIFLLPATLAPFGANAIWAWLIAIGGILCLAIVFAALARKFPEASGPYDYIRPTLGAFIGFLAMWAYWITLWVSNAALAIGAVSYLSFVAPALGGNGPTGPAAALGFLLFFAWLSSRGVRVAGATQVLTTLLKLLPLVAVVLIGALVLGGVEENAGTGLAAMPVSSGAVASAAALAVFALLGFECAAIPAARVSNPGRNIALATLAGTLLVGGLYLVVTVTVGLLLPTAQVAQSNAPLADLIGHYWGSGASVAIALFAAISALGALNGFTMLQGEVPAALARRGIFPRIFAHENRAGAPIFGIWTGCLLSCLILLANYGGGLAVIFNALILLVTLANFVLYPAVAVTALVLIGRGTMRGAGLAVAAALGTAFSAWVVYGSGREAVLWALALVASALPVYALMAWKRRSSPAPEPVPAAPAG
jgi:APA family basic amino acid/polyamine antiporter